MGPRTPHRLKATRETSSPADSQSRTVVVGERVEEVEVVEVVEEMEDVWRMVG